VTGKQKQIVARWRALVEDLDLLWNAYLRECDDSIAGAEMLVRGRRVKLDIETAAARMELR
jgi:hypothetical protein